VALGVLGAGTVDADTSPREAVTSYDRMQPGAPHHGYFDHAWQSFTAQSANLTHIGVTVGNPDLTAGAPAPYTVRIRLCDAEPDADGSCANVIASADADIVNYGNSYVDIGDAEVTKGSTYWIVWDQPDDVSGTTWVTYWWEGGDAIATSDQLQMVVRGYDPQPATEPTPPAPTTTPPSAPGPPPRFASSGRVAMVADPNAPGSGGTLPTSGPVEGASYYSFDKYSFTDVPIDGLDAPTLAGYDTVVLNQVLTASLSPGIRQALSGFVTGGGKLVIHDSDATSGNDYGWLPVPASTGRSCVDCGETDGTATIVENNAMVSATSTDTSYVAVQELQDVTDAIGDANVMVTQDSRWYVDVRATNHHGESGAVHTYASDGGLIVFNGFDTDYAGSTQASGVDWLGKLWYLELAQPWVPDRLPRTAPIHPPATFRYRAIGDSVAAGFGISTPPSTWIACAGHLPNNDCDDRAHAYPQLVTDKLRAGGTDVRDENLSIAGSTPADWLPGGRAQVPDRFSALVAADPDLVTVTLGANDLLSHKWCLLSDSCVGRRLVGTTARVAAILGELQHRTHAQILITHYHDVVVDPSGAVRNLNAAIDAAAGAPALRGRVRVVTLPSFAAHVCGRAPGWMNGDCLHPNAEGQRQYAGAVLAAYAGHPLGPPRGLAAALSRLDTAANIVFLPHLIRFNLTSLFVRQVQAVYVSFVGRVVARRRARGSRLRTRTITFRVRPRYRRGVASIRLRVPRAFGVRRVRLYVRVGRKSAGCRRRCRVTLSPRRSLGRTPA
jgi:lysophospholipase L1-like esterase